MNSRRAVLLLGILLTVNEAGYTQGRSSLFSGPISVSGGVEHIPGPGGVSESFVLVTPIRPLLFRETRRSSFRFVYTPELEFQGSGGKLTSWNHSLTLAAGHAFGRRTKLDFAHSFMRSSDPARLFTDYIVVAPRNNFHENATVVSFRREISRQTTLATRADSTFAQVSVPDRSDATYLKEYGLAGTASLTYHTSQRQKFTASYSLLRFSPYRPLRPDDNSGFLASIPTYRAGISRFAMVLALNSAAYAVTPTSVMGDVSTPGTPRTPTTPAAAAPGVVENFVSPNSQEPAYAANSSEPGPLIGLLMPVSSSEATVPATVPIKPALVSRSGPFAAFAVDPAETFTASPEPSSPGSLMGDPFHSMAFIYSYLPGRALTLQLAGGVMADHNASYLLGGQIERRFDRLWVSSRIQHFRSDLGSGALIGIPTTSNGVTLPEGEHARSYYTSATFIVGGKLTYRTDLDFSAAVARNSANFLDRSVRNIIGRVSLNRWVTDKLGIFVSAETLYARESGLQQYSRQRFFGGVQYRISKPLRPDPASAPPEQ